MYVINQESGSTKFNLEGESLYILAHNKPTIVTTQDFCGFKFADKLQRKNY